MATYTRIYTIKKSLNQLGGVRRKFPLSGDKVSVTGETTVPMKKITGIKVTRFHAVNLSNTWYLKAGFSKNKDDSGNFSFISSDKQSINSTSFVEKPAYFKEGERTLLYADGDSITVSTLPTPTEWDKIVKDGALVLFANRLGHEYLGSSIENLPSDYYLLTLVDDSHPITITVTYEGEEQQEFTIESLSATRIDNTGKFSVFLKINYSNDYIFTSNDTMTAYLSKNSNISNPIGDPHTFGKNEWEIYKLGSSFTWEGASEPDTVYYIGVTATVNGKIAALITTLPQLSSSSTNEGATNFHLSGSGKGVGVGGLSKGTVENPSFDCFYPSTFYNDVTINGNISLGGESAIPKVLYGTASLSLSGRSGDITINFGESFESAPVVTATLYRPHNSNNTGGAYRQPYYAITEITESKFSLHCYQGAETTGTTNYSVKWIAIGT